MIREWIKRKCLAIIYSRKPDFLIGPAGNPYMRRWWVIPRNRFFNIYLHEILHDDDDRALHDHPWVNCSYVVEKGYWENMPGHDPVWRAEGSFVFRRPTALHRLTLHRDEPSAAMREAGMRWCADRAITLFITGPRVREWGFQCPGPKGWIPWHQFTKADKPGEVGPGCGD